MSETYFTEAEYQEHCWASGAISLEVSKRFDPNPWIFKVCFRPNPCEKRFIVVFRNFECTKELTVTYTLADGSESYTFQQKPTPL